MGHRFFIADVFTDLPFTGNQLAVFPDAAGLSDRAMQAIAREFNFAETTFVLPAREAKHAARVRIFTPKAELPFAGHPTIGTAAVLARLKRVDVPGTIVLEEGVGPVPVEMGRQQAHLVVERQVAVPSEKISPGAAAAALSVPESAVQETWFADGGVRFCFVRLKDKAAVDQAVLDRAAWSRHFAKAWASNLYLFAGDENLHVRMFAPALGVEEDPATGSAAVAIAGVLGARLAAREGTFTWRIDQGVAMGRPSRIEAIAEKRDGRVTRIKVGGATVIGAEGTMEVPSGY
ncbi:MAG TPA: PhzF family phenazine biosynthesis protein [Burkholderiales bacterium]|nr:PhzF family phenazine biosynthesis protein [Burkholderiales bacterium]